MQPPTSDGQAIARRRIADEARRRTGSLDLGGLGLEYLPPELFELTHLRALNLGCHITRTHRTVRIVTNSGHGARNRFGNRVNPLPMLPDLCVDAANCISLNPLTSLSALTNLRSLAVVGADIADLDFVAELANLRVLECGENPIEDLAPLARLRGMRLLGCFATRVTDLAPLSDLTALRLLDCRRNKIADLGPLAAVRDLRFLYCSDSLVTDLRPLAGLRDLSVLWCGRDKIADLSPLRFHTALRHVVISGTEVEDITPLSAARALCSFSCANSRVASLEPLADHTALRKVDGSHCALTVLPESLVNSAALETLVLFATRVAGVPSEVLSRRIGENCLGPVRAHFSDLAAGAAALNDVKLIVLGNGRAGKTQICRRLRGEAYDDSEKSTHGILVTSATLDIAETAPIRLNIWDFGGQDLYHGTHALFLRTSAIFLVVWASETENAREHVHDGVTFRNQELPYWLAYVRHLGAADSPVLVVQTRCDREQDAAPLLPLSAGDVRAFGHWVGLRYSALNDRGRPALDGALREAVAWLRLRQGSARIGVGRMAVRRELQRMRDCDAALPAEQRRYRTLNLGDFERLCEAAGNVSSPEHLLAYLHNAGIVFHRGGVFNDDIILDQGWALDAIYAVFNREKCYLELMRRRGRFTRPLLQELVWGEHSVDEQRLFLAMMRSCGVCFADEGDPDWAAADDTEFIAPDLLPERNSVRRELDARWHPDRPTETVTFTYELLHPGVVRGIICDIGAKAGRDALYWRGGVCVFEKITGGLALIEQHMTDAWRGGISVRTQGGKAAQLCEQLAVWIEERTNQEGPRATRDGPIWPLSMGDPDQTEAPRERSGGGPPGAFGPFTGRPR